MSTGWEPTSVVTQDWGRPQIIIRGLDVTYFRGVETVVNELTYTEPFDDALAELYFATITPMEALPWFLIDGAEVLIYKVPDVGAKTLIFRGLFMSEEDTISETQGGLTIQVAGVLYQADLLRKTPALNYGQRARDGVRYGVKDVGQIIAAELSRPGLRFGPVSGYSGSENIIGVPTTERGAFDLLLTEYIAGLLSTATSYTIMDGGEGAYGIVAHPDGGYYIVTNEGSVIAFGGAPYRGSLKGLSLRGDVRDMAISSDGSGYWLIGADGGVFAFGAPYLENNIGEPDDHVAIESDPDGLGYWLLATDGGVFTYGAASFHGSAFGLVAGDAVDMAVHPDGDGYWVLDETGAVYAFGSASYHGGQNPSSGFTGITPTPTGDGYWLLKEDGGVFSHGDATFHGTPFGGMSVGAVARSIQAVGDGYLVLASDGSVYAYGDAVYYGNGHDGLADVSQWSLGLTASKQRPRLYVKDTTTEHWSVYCGAPGITHSLSRDLAMSFNVVYGEGISRDNCRWRNSRYPTVTTDVEDAIILPLASETEAEPYLYNDDGTILSVNPDYNQWTVLRVEHYEHFGEAISKNQGVALATGALKRDGAAFYAGELTLKSDPIEGSRFDIRAGQNIVFKGHRGEDRMLHIAAARIGLQDGTVKLVVSERAIDYLSVLALLERDRKGVTPARRRTYRNMSSRHIVDTAAVWDCESGAGIIASTTLQGNRWNILRVPGGERGTVARTSLQLGPTAQFAMGVFDRPVSESILLARGDVTAESDYWDVDFEEDTGLIIAWGGLDQMAGYYPGLESEGDAITGKLVDDASWYFESTEPPWLWVAIYPVGSGTFAALGRMHPGLES